ncbi:IS200/IS605 family transposase [Winogradskya humida]|uniref:IS200/IS605 family transposase n=1 Tax=Winogradskya humida TaxID=113566 RepID=UPI0023B28D7A|nr:IS200/IS605 family transposase [Actinoplanes humidus]
MQRTPFGLRHKFRHRMFSDRHLARMGEIMWSVCTDFETELVEFNHICLLVNFPPKVAPAKPVNSLKGVSSRRMRQEFPDRVRHYYQVNKLWSGSYFAGHGPPNMGPHPRPEGRSAGPHVSSRRRPAGTSGRCGRCRSIGPLRRRTRSHKLCVR